VVGPSGAGKSELALRLLARGFELVADDQVDIAGGVASCPPTLAGLLEARGLGIVRLPHRQSARLVLVIELSAVQDRMPYPCRHPQLDVPLVRLDPARPGLVDLAILALDCALGRVVQVAGAFTA
jgi:HPr kinase/phosphorylase